MANIKREYSLQPGDVLVRSKSVFGIIDHYGLYIGNGKVIDNHPDRGVSKISLGKFLDGASIKRVRRFRGSWQKRKAVINRAFALLGRRYHLTDFNCEHFVNYVLGLGKRSQQIKIAGGILLTSFALWGVNRISQ